ncbi:MAG TPA: dockerin type I domain-containing protein [Tepidisphaeraceae bacterium]|jgi:hypothetical protein
MSAAKTRIYRIGLLFCALPTLIFGGHSLANTVYWDGGVDSEWTTPGNWSSAALPGPSDDAVLNEMPFGSPYTVALSGTQSVNSINTDSTSALNITNGSLAIASNSEIDAALTLNSATISGNGNLTLNGVTTWGPAIMNGTGAINVGTTATVTVDLSGSQNITSNKTINNSGVFDDEGGLCYIDISTFNNLAGGIYNASQDGFSGGVFNNYGQYNKLGASTLVSYANFNNESGSALDVNAGQLSLEGGSNTNSGIITVASGATLAVHNLTVAAGSVGGLGTIEVFGGAFSAGTFNPAGPLDLSGTVTINNAISPTNLDPITGAKVTFNGALNYAGPVTIEGGEVYFGADESLTSLTIGSDATVYGLGTLAVSNSLTWSSGELGSYGSVSIYPSGQATISSTASLIATGNLTLVRTLEIDGTANWNASVGLTAGVIVNDGIFTINNTNEVDFNAYTFMNSFSNSGSFIKQGSGTAAFLLMFNGASLDVSNSGTMEIEAGKLLLGAGGTDTRLPTFSNSGTIKIDAGATLETQGPMTNTGTIDVAGGTVILDQGLASASVLTQLHNGFFAGGVQPEITSSVHASVPGKGIGYSISGSTYLLEVTWWGDTNLDGTVNAADFEVLSQNLGKFNSGGATWSDGDFNYDGIVNADDESLFLLGAASYQASLPEPSTLAWLMSSILFASRRNRNKKAHE